MSLISFPLTSGFLAENAGLYVSPGWGIHPDRVIQSYELIFVRSGELHLEEEGKEFAAGPSCALILFPGRRHRGIQGYAKALSFYWIHFRPLAFGQSESGQLSIPQFSRPARPDQLTELFRRYLDDQESDALLPVQAGLIVSQMLVELGRPSGKPDLANRSLVGRAEQYIASHFLEGIHASDVAQAVGCHPDYLGRLYRQTLGSTLSEAIHRKQIMEARHLLRESSLNIEEIALACGFQGSRYFRQLFLQFQGISPRIYRDLYSRAAINHR